MKRHKLKKTYYFFTFFCFLWTFNQGICEGEPASSNPYIAPPFASKLNRGNANTIVPYSQFMQEQVEEHRRLFNKTQPYSSSDSHQQEEDGTRPLIIYLPAFSKASASFISDKEEDQHQKSIFSTKKSSLWKAASTPRNPIRPQIRQDNLQGSSPDDYISSNTRKAVSSVQDNSKLSSLATYSTNFNREPLPHKNSVFRPRFSNTLSPKNDAFNQSPAHIFSPTRHSSAENSLITRPSSMFQTARVSSNKYSPNLAQYSRIVPAPHNTLSSTPSEDNIVNSIFAQSQVRHAPPGPLFNGPPPLAGSPFDLLNSLNPQAALGALEGGRQGAVGGSQLLNPLAMLGQGGSTIEQISKIAKNLLSMGSGNQELFSAVTKAIGGGAVDAGSKLTSTAVISPESAALLKSALAKEDAVLNGSVPDVSTAGSNASNTLVQETLFSNGGGVAIKEEAIAGGATPTANSSMKILSSLPREQRNLLEAAIKNGELDAATLAPTLSTLLEHQSKSGMIRAENKLMEWIQQNRPRTAEKDINNVRVLAADKLPYYGKYCGSFVELPTASKHFNVAGAVWAVDDRRLIVSKFNFQPGAGSENVTFWAGPVNHTGTALDAIPSENGFYLMPEPVDIQAFMVHQVEKLNAKVRSPAITTDKLLAGGNKTAEQEEQEGEAGGDNKLASNQLRMKRNLYDDLYANNQKKITLPIHFSVPIAKQNQLLMNSTDQSFMHTPAPNLISNLQQTSPSSDSSLSTSSPAATLQIITGGTLASIIPVMSPPLTTPSPLQFNPFGGDVFGNNAATSTSQMIPLQWYAGFQPLLLTLPKDKWIKSLHWVSLFDHKKKQAIASVLIPNGVAFTIPSLVQLRSLSPNGAYQVKSGSIKVLDTKTIEIDEFSLTTNGIPVWFMVGKEIMPNANGHIVPVYNKATKIFDCDSLQDYHNKTITLRLPGTMDIKDVFWFSVFSIPRSISLAHMYLPYNDMHLPPDLLGVSTPECLWMPQQ